MRPILLNSIRSGSKPVTVQGALTVGGARAEFELFVLDLVKAQMPEVGTVRGKGGRDWGH